MNHERNQNCRLLGFVLCCVDVCGREGARVSISHPHAVSLHLSPFSLHAHTPHTHAHTQTHSLTIFLTLAYVLARVELALFSGRMMDDKLMSLLRTCKEQGCVESVHLVMLVEQHGHPHVLLIQPHPKFSSLCVCLLCSSSALSPWHSQALGLILVPVLNSIQTGQTQR